MLVNRLVVLGMACSACDSAGVYAGGAGPVIWAAVKRSEPLDGLRGIAVLLVLASHASNAGHDLLPALDASGLGRSGVFLFFVLSSYLLTSQVLGRLDAGKPIGWGRYALRRLLRVMPAYALP